jgi:hypothetical protein
MTAHFKVVRNIIDGPVIHDAALVHQDQIVKGVENLRRWLMNGKQHTSTGIRHLFEHLTQLDSRKAIKPTRWFIQKDKFWFLEKGEAYRDQKIEAIRWHRGVR